MAKARKALKAPKVKKERRAKTTLHAEIKYIGEEPRFEKQPKPEDYNGVLNRTFSYYDQTEHHFVKKSDVVTWMDSNGDFDRKEKTTYRKSNDKLTSKTVMKLARMANRGLELRPEHKEYILKHVRSAIVETDPDAVEEKKPGRKKKTQDTEVQGLFANIQQRMLEQARGLAGEFDEDMDRVFTKQESTVDFYKYLVDNQVTKPVAAKMRAMFEETYNEINEAKGKKADEQLAEGYAFLKGKQLKNVLEWFERMFSDFDNYVKHKNLHRKPRKKKVVSADKLTSKIKYLKEHKPFRIVSIQPKEIVGAQQLWIFNVKNRKLGRYVAEEGGQLSVKGTAILGYDERHSICKTVRKPDKTLPELMKAGKVALRTFLDGIKATPTRMKPRIGKDCVLLRVL